LLLSLSFPWISHLVGKYSFDVLEAMRVEVKTLTERLARMGPLIKLIVRREWIKSEMRAFETKASEKSRLFGRSTQLLEEEKFRKIVAHEFPRLTEKLKKGLVKYEVPLHDITTLCSMPISPCLHCAPSLRTTITEQVHGTVRVSGKALPEDHAGGTAAAQLCSAPPQALLRFVLPFALSFASLC
jgi:hypothetical protein